VIDVDVTMTISYRPDGRPKTIDFTVAHHTMHGATYVREEQYNARRWYMPDFNRAVWQWNGHLNTNHNVVMVGELSKPRNTGPGVFWYREWVASPDRYWQEVTRSVCREN
jgi:hypothetical protein